MKPTRLWILIATLIVARLAFAQAPATSPAHLPASDRAVLDTIVPLPPDAPHEIKNPYHAMAIWKLWAEDSEPVVLDRADFSGKFAAIPKDKRKYPTFGDSWASGLPPLVASEAPVTAGLWDDSYMSLDYHHTHLTQPAGQFIDAGKMRHSRDWKLRFSLGVNFTSQSHANRGRHIVDDTLNNLTTEKYFYFANCIRATPSHISYRDNDPAMSDDLYDGLFAHSYHSVGQSGSEIYALEKMMIAGACLPRETKNRLKKDGLYAVVLLTLFKAALPYTDADGNLVPYENELRHRPAYSSHGTPQHAHYCAANVPYHAYDDDRHIRAMCQMARTMTTPPPVTIIKPLETKILRGDGEAMDPREIASRFKGVSLTNVRLWGQAGETLIAMVSLADSYDLGGKPLTFTCQPVYPNQKNVSVKQVDAGLYQITVKHDPKQPKGRIPVICVARNDSAVPGNPVFMNFYFAEENEQDDYAHLRGGKPDGKVNRPVNVNLKPVVDLGLPGDVLSCRPGQTVSIDLKATDPEGYPVTVYRWPGQEGAIADGKFVYQIPPDAKPAVVPVNLVFADGTGGYTGKQLRLVVQQGDAALPEGWAVGPLGNSAVDVQADWKGDILTFRPEPPSNPKAKAGEGLFLFKATAGSTDLAIRLDDTNAIGLMIRRTLDPSSRHIRITRESDGVVAEFRQSESIWGYYPRKADATLAMKGKQLRITRRDGIAGVYLSDDGQTYEQLVGGALALPGEHLAGVAYTGGNGAASCHVITEPSEALPLFDQIAKWPDRKTGLFPGQVKLAIHPPMPDQTVRYTMDCSNPTAASPVYDEPITFTEPGRHELRAAVFTDDQPGPVVVGVYTIREASSE